jgi:phosphotransacetylase
MKITIIIINEQADSKQSEEEITVDFNTTPFSIIDNLLQMRIIPDKEFQLYEIRQHEKSNHNINNRTIHQKMYIR